MIPSLRSGLCLPACSVVLALPAAGQQQLSVLSAPAPTTDERVGFSVAIDGGLACLGTPGTSLGLIGGGTIPEVGSVHLFEASGSTWLQTAELRPDVSLDGEFLGRDVALSGQRVVAGAPYADFGGLFSSQTDAGRVVVFDRDFLGNWFQEVELRPADPSSDDVFGWSVAVEGSRVVVGAPKAGPSGAVYVFQDSPLGWLQTAKLEPFGINQADFGRSVAIRGGRIVVGAPDTAVAGLTGVGSAYVYELEGGLWVETQVLPLGLTPEGRFGNAVDIDGDRLLIGSDGLDGSTGGAFVFERGFFGGWTQSAFLRPVGAQPADRFGFSVALEGDTAVVGRFTSSTMPPQDSAYLFNAVGAGWHQTCDLTAAVIAQSAGYAVDIDGGRVLVGDPFATAGAFHAGRAVLFAESNGAVAGCTALNPPGSLTPVGGAPSIGSSWTLEVANPLGTQGPGSAAFLAASLVPAIGLDCGPLLPGWGMGGAGLPGELLVSADPPVLLGPVAYDGVTPVPFALALPDLGTLIGRDLVVQALVVGGPGSVAELGLTEARTACIGVPVP